MIEAVDDSMNVICFDLDGTLSDPKLGITRSIQHAHRELGRPFQGADDLTWCIGPPLLGSFKKLLDSRKEAENALLLYRERFTETGIYENELHPGIAAALSGLKSSGRRMFVATSKPKAFADRIIEHFGLSPYFEGIYGSEFDGTRSDKSELLGWVVAQERLSPAKTVMSEIEATTLPVAAKTAWRPSEFCMATARWPSYWKPE